MEQHYEKLKIAIKYRLYGRADLDPTYHLATKAYEFGRRWHKGVRKDGVTPEYMHQISQANYIMTLSRSLIYPAETLAVVFLHDVVEDYPVTLDEIRREFGERVATAVGLMTNTHPNGDLKDLAAYYEAMAEDPIASVDKGGDGWHNGQTMHTAPDKFPREKQLALVERTRTHLLPMLAKARRNFPEQELAYENIKHLLLVQCDLLEYANGRAA